MVRYISTDEGAQQQQCQFSNNHIAVHTTPHPTTHMSHIPADLRVLEQQRQLVRRDGTRRLKAIVYLIKGKKRFGGKV